MLLDDPGEFHPYAFCVLKKAGLSPWGEIRLIVNVLGLGDLPDKPVMVRHLGGPNKRKSAVTRGRAEG